MNIYIYIFLSAKNVDERRILKYTIYGIFHKRLFPCIFFSLSLFFLLLLSCALLGPFICVPLNWNGSSKPRNDIQFNLHDTQIIYAVHKCFVIVYARITKVHIQLLLFDMTRPLTTLMPCTTLEEKNDAIQSGPARRHTHTHTSKGVRMKRENCTSKVFLAFVICLTKQSPDVLFNFIEMLFFTSDIRFSCFQSPERSNAHAD